METSPAAPHAANSQNGDASDRAISDGVRKIPIPTTSPTTTAVAAASPSRRGSAAGGARVSDGRSSVGMGFLRSLHMS